MAECDICKILEHKDAFHIVYEDDKCFAFLHESPAIAGHTLVVPKKHAPILEELDDELVEHLYNVSNKVSSAIFDTIGAHGTNIVLNNGTAAGQELPHVLIHVLPRKEDDGMNLEWQPKKAEDQELKTTQSMIQRYVDMVFSGKRELPEAKVKKPVKKDSDEIDYEVRGLQRIP